MSFERTADADDVVHVAAPRRQGLIELFFNFVQTATSPSAKVRVVGSNEYDGQEYTLAALDQEAIIPELEFLQHVIFPIGKCVLHELLKHRQHSADEVTILYSILSS